jgi:hypothetical protein
MPLLVQPCKSNRRPRSVTSHGIPSHWHTKQLKLRSCHFPLSSHLHYSATRIVTVFVCWSYLPRHSQRVCYGAPLLLLQIKLVFRTASREALRPTQPPIQWVPGSNSPGIKRHGSEADHSAPSSADVNNCGVIPPLLCTASWLGA